MKKKLGFSLIFVSLILTFIFWMLVTPIQPIPLASQYSELVGTLALVGFTWVNFISTRNPILDKWFNGLDATYIYHKFLSIISLLLVIIHKLLIDMGKTVQVEQAMKPVKNPFGWIGSISMILFVALTVIALTAKKLNYERWKLIHKFMIIPYIIGLVHYYGSSNYDVLGLDPFSIFVNIMNVIGLTSAIYSIFIYETTSFKYKFKVNQLEIVANNMLEITGSSINNTIEFLPGQFAFLKLIRKDINFPSHPFTISQAPKKGEIQFTIKSLGDHTQNLLNTIKIGDEILVSGPHGKFNYTTGNKKQLWIAGGIGITPFRSFYESNIPDNYYIDFFYAYNNEKENAYVDEIINMPQRENLKIHLINSQKEGFLTADKIRKCVNKDDPLDVYFCGPKPMRENLKKQFTKNSFNIINFHYEHFQFK